MVENAGCASFYFGVPIQVVLKQRRKAYKQAMSPALLPHAWGVPIAPHYRLLCYTHHRANVPPSDFATEGLTPLPVNMPNKKCFDLHAK